MNLPWVFPKIWENPQIIHLFIGFSLIFTIHFGGKIPLFLVQHPHGEVDAVDTLMPLRLPGLPSRRLESSSTSFWSPLSRAVGRCRVQILAMEWCGCLGGGFKYLLFSSLFGEMIQFD